MVFWQLTINANNPARLADFWEQALGWSRVPPDEPDTPWWRHYRRRLAAETRFDDRLFDPEGLRPSLWFQLTEDAKDGNNRLHLDLAVTGRDDTLSLDARVSIVEKRVAELTELGAVEAWRGRGDDPDDPFFYVVMRDPEGNEFCLV